MMGNIGLTKSGLVVETRLNPRKKEFIDKMARELDIDVVIGNGQRAEENA